MTAKDAIKYSMDTAMMVLQTYVSDLNDAELLTRPAKGANHLAWQLGHLISSENQLINSVCPGACPELPAGFGDRHGKDATGVDDPSKFLKKQQYLDLFTAQRQGAKAALEKLPDAELDRPAPAEMRSYCPTVGDVFHLAGDHVLMHSGQFATVRRLLGKPILI